HGTSVSMGAAGAAGGGGVVDSAALDAYADTVTGENGVLATAARQVLSQLGLVEEAPETPETDNTLFETVKLSWVPVGKRPSPHPSTPSAQCFSMTAGHPRVKTLRA